MKHFAEFVSDFESVELSFRASLLNLKVLRVLKTLIFPTLTRAYPLSPVSEGVRKKQKELEIFLSKNLDRFEEEK